VSNLPRSPFLNLAYWLNVTAAGVQAGLASAHHPNPSPLRRRALSSRSTASSLSRASGLKLSCTRRPATLLSSGSFSCSMESLFTFLISWMSKLVEMVSAPWPFTTCTGAVVRDAA
jgi:hypothetical protein